MQTVNFPAPPRSESSRSNDRSAQRKPAPSPLQVSQISSPITEKFVQTSPRELGSPGSSRGGSGNSYSPRSPHDSPAFAHPSSRSPNEGVPRPPAESRQGSKDSVTNGLKKSPLATPRADPSRQMRNVSAPIPQGDRSAESPPHLPVDMANVRTKSSLARADARFIPRTSSLDSTMSTTSSATTMSHSLTPDPLSPRPEEINQLIASAGSPEAAIAQLLKEKKQAAAQNAQLFRLVQKQRSVMGGMKTDLDGALQERDTYRKRLKETSSNVTSPTPLASSTVEALRQPSRGDSVSTIMSEDELPIQRHSVGDEKSADVQPETKPSTEPPKARKETLERPSALALRSAAAISQSSSPTQGSPASLSNLERLQVDDSDSRRTTIQSPMTPIAPLEIHKRTSPTTEDTTTGGSKPGTENVSSPASFAARRSMTGNRKTSTSSPVVGPGSPTYESANTSPIARKGPPAPLNLHRPAGYTLPQAPLPKSPEEYGPEDHTDSDYEDIGEVEELPAFARGRKKTREEDDKERAYIMLQEQDSRSRSKKQKSKSASKASPNPPAEPLQKLPTSASQPSLRSPPIKGFAPISPASSRQDHLSPHASLAGMLSGPPSSSGSIVERTVTLSPPLASPGLPVSPRPVDRHVHAALPRSPRDGFTSPPLTSPRASQPLSPRPPRQPIPLPPHTPSTLSPPPPYSQHSGDSDPPRVPPRSPGFQSTQQVTAPKSPRLEPKAMTPRSPIPSLASSPNSKVPASAIKVNTNATTHGHSSSDLHTGGVYRGLVSENYPDLLLPPNAIPLITIKVVSSRLKPSRHSTLSPKGTDEEPVFTLGIAARSDTRQLWRVEKSIMSLPQLEQHLKQACAFDIKLPDKSLFSGQSPAKIDARREALEKYFEAMLDTPMVEKAALTICQYLSTQVVPAEEHEGVKSVGNAEDQSPATVGPDGRIVKEGYLTKRGKQFGGWKARFFVLDEPVLRYYDAPGGSLQGTIKLTNAQIGRQNAHHAHHSPTRSEDPDSQFRHAFLVLEPKKKDSNSHMKHVLCAESDEERDEWVYALLQYVGIPTSDAKSRPGAIRTASDSKGSITSASKKGEKDEPSPEHGDSFNSLQGTSYEETSYADPPTRMAPQPPAAPSPHKTSFSGNQSHGPVTISKPSNGSVIQDVSAWGNKAPASPRSKDKEQKKRSIWGFRTDKLTDVGASHANSSNPNIAMSAPRNPTVKVFGAPLHEAVEFCMARGTTVPLPSVVYRCIEYLEAKGAANEEGVFRLSGSNLLIKQLKEKFNNNGDFDFLAEDTYYDVHAVASLLKLYLRELPSMVLTRELHMEFLQYMECEDKAQKIAGYNMLVHKLPLPNWTLVRALSQFLIGIVNNSAVNRMTVRNVGIVFAPTLNVPAPVFASFLTDFDAIFVADPNGEQPSNPPVSSPLTPEDIRSPRRQIFSDIPTPSYQQNKFPQQVQQAEPFQQVQQAQPVQQAHQTLQAQQLQPVQPARHYDDPSRNRIEGQGRAAGGFIPMQPAYEPVYLRAPSRQSVLVPGPDQRHIQDGSGAPNAARDNKARRRESSMMFMGGGATGAFRKSSMPSMGQPLNEE